MSSMVKKQVDDAMCFLLLPGRSVAELQVSGVRANFTKRPYDTSVALTVHSLLVVDALQTYGPDYELLVASHRNIWWVTATDLLNREPFYKTLIEK